jgi:hypothetical protein
MYQYEAAAAHKEVGGELGSLDHFGPTVILSKQGNRALIDFTRIIKWN